MNKKNVIWLMATVHAGLLVLLPTRSSRRSSPRSGIWQRLPLPAVLGLAVRHFSRRCEISVILKGKTSTLSIVT